MANLFMSLPGRVSIVRSPRADGEMLPGAVYLQDHTDSTILLTTRVIITNLLYDQNTHTQFQHTLLNAIYMYSFGDKMGTVQVQGIAFNSHQPNDFNCVLRNDLSLGAAFNPAPFAAAGGAVFAPSAAGTTGVEDILALYNQYRVSRANLPIVVMVGRKRIKGFLVGCRVQTLSPELLTSSFVLTIASLPALDNVLGG